MSAAHHLGQQFPPFFAVDDDGRQFIGYHFTNTKNFHANPAKVPKGPFASGTPGELFVTFDRRMSLNDGRDVVSRPYAAEVWAKQMSGDRHNDDWRAEAMDQQRVVNVTEDDVRIRRVIPSSLADQHLSQLSADDDDEEYAKRQQAFGVKWTARGNHYAFDPAPRWPQ